RREEHPAERPYHHAQQGDHRGEAPQPDDPHGRRGADLQLTPANYRSIRPSISAARRGEHSCHNAPGRKTTFPASRMFRITKIAERTVRAGRMAARMKPAAMAKSVHCISSWAFRSALTALSRSSGRVLAITGTRASVEGEDCSCAFLQVQGYGAGDFRCL